MNVTSQQTWFSHFEDSCIPMCAFELLKGNAAHKLRVTKTSTTLHYFCSKIIT